jgi:hypothetical protein
VRFDATGNGGGGSVGMAVLAFLAVPAFGGDVGGLIGFGSVCVCGGGASDGSF